METIEYLFPNKLKTGDLLEVQIPLKQLPVGTLIFVVRGNEKITLTLNSNNEELLLLEKDELLHLKYLQQTNVDYDTVTHKFSQDKSALYFHILFKKLTQLSTLN